MDIQVANGVNKRGEKQVSRSRRDMTIEVSQLILFLLAFTVMVVTPGPFVAAIAARSAAYGFRSGFAMAAGGSMAEIIFVTLAIFGLSTLAEAHGWTLEILKYIGAAWLIWIGWRLVSARAETVLDDALPPAGPAWRSFLNGLLINIGNPKPALFYAAIFPGFFDMSRIGWMDGVVIVACTLPLGLASDLTYAGAASRARTLLRSPRALTRLNRGTGGVLMGAGVVIGGS